MDNKTFQKEHFEKYDYESEYDWDSDKRIKVLLKLMPNSNGKLLDIGCNYGKTCEFFRDKGYEVSGIDISEKAVAKAKAKGFDVRLGDITKNLPYTDNSFEAVFIGEVLEHILNPKFLLTEAYRLLKKKKGVLYITVPNISSLRNIFLILFGRLPAHSCDYDSTHIRDFCKRDLHHLLSSIGFISIVFKGDCLAIPVNKKLSINLPPFSSRLSDYLIIKCIKR